MMVALLLILGGLLTYLLFDKGFWLDRWAKSSEKESFKIHTDEYERRNRLKESWMTKHDREYEQSQYEEDKWRQ
jgi:5-bromo-4-chloroindolyl phosphate hydrolysis protein